MLAVRQFRSSDYVSVWALHRLAVDGIGVSAPDWYFADLNEIESAFLNNRGEFVVWHGEYVTAGREHYGIIVSEQKPIGQMLRELLAFLQTHSAEEIRSQIFFLRH